MLKFTIIDSPQQISRNRFIESLKKRLVFSQEEGEAFKNRTRQAFIVVESKNKQLVGGACLLKKTKNDIYEDLRDIVSPLIDKDVWECSAIYFDAPICCLALGMPPVESILQIFYHDLYETLIEFGLKHKINFIIMKLLEEVYKLTKNIGLWPYVVALKPHSSLDGLFHGILPLTGSQYEAYHCTWGVQKNLF